MQKVNFCALFKKQSWSFCKKAELPEPFTDCASLYRLVRWLQVVKVFLIVLWSNRFKVHFHWTHEWWTVCESCISSLHSRKVYRNKTNILEHFEIFEISRIWKLLYRPMFQRATGLHTVETNRRNGYLRLISQQPLGWIIAKIIQKIIKNVL